MVKHWLHDLPGVQRLRQQVHPRQELPLLVVVVHLLRLLVMEVGDLLPLPWLRTGTDPVLSSTPDHAVLARSNPVRANLDGERSGRREGCSKLGLDRGAGSLYSAPSQRARGAGRTKRHPKIVGGSRKAKTESRWVKWTKAQPAR